MTGRGTYRILIQRNRRYIYNYSFSWDFYPKQLTIAMYVWGRTPLEQL